LAQIRANIQLLAAKFPPADPDQLQRDLLLQEKQVVARLAKAVASKLASLPAVKKKTAK